MVASETLLGWWTIVVPCIALLFLTFRGYGATIRSAVFDSVLLYNDTGVVIPSFELSLMAVNLFMISFCLVAVSAGLTSFLISLLSDRGGTMVSKYLPWVLAGIFFVIASVLLEYLQGHAVVGAMEALLFSASVLGYSGYLHRQARRNQSLIAPGSLFIALALAAVLFYTLLAEKTHEKDRERIQVFASEFLRPVDSWLTFVIDEGLRMFEDKDVRNTLAGGQSDEIDRLALTLWAKSSACREGYSCLFALFDSSGREMSRFEIGNRNLLDSQSGLWHRLSATQSIHVQQVGAGVNAFKVYRGSVPIRSNGRIIAHGVVVVSAGQQSLFRGESPSFLRSSSPESLESFYRPVTVAEFQHGTLFASTSDIFPHHFVLPGPLRKLLEDKKSSSAWGDLSVGGQQYETLFVKGSGQDGQIIALCLPAEDIFWYLLSAVKMLWYYFLVVVLALVGYLMLSWWEGKPYQPTFRDKLLIALLVTATLPVIAIAFYGKTFAEQRLMDETAGWLDRETDVLAFQILQELEPEGGKPLDHLTPDAVEEIASDLGTDFNFYVNNELQSTSRPELYAAGLLDPRLSGAAYSSVILNGDKFYHQPENVGLYRYAVGYRAVFDQQGALLGVVSVPTLYRQDELDREVSQQNAFLFGVYAVVFLAITILAATVANRIASPIHHLTEATRKVSRGELDVTLNLGHTDGEIGELVRSFEAMTRDLKRGRDDLVRFERELAWKEMAKQVAHEIKNPLTPMRLSMQHLRQTYRDRVADFDRIIEDVTRTVIEQIDTLSRIASEFSRFGRMPKPSIESCDVNTVVDEAASLFEQQKGVNIERMLEPGLPPVQADWEELRRAFINIMRNGIQAMGGRGKMTIRTGMNANKIMIAIRDFGVGIPDEIKPKLFRPNFSTKTDGMGLGLAIVKNTIDHLQGTIKVESKVHEGTEVTILLPVDNRTVGS